jgi:NAD(P)-dependent dehydrogenase (short-subunit alcohol dehydrogenase family)
VCLRRSAVWGASIWGTEGREFKSPQPDKETPGLNRRFAAAGVSRRKVRVRSGRIVNIVSRTAGIAFPHTSGYASAKAGLVRFTDCLAAETIEHDVRVFALGPGLIHTEIIRSVERSDTAMRWMSDVLDGLSYLSPDIPAWAVVYLASGRADALSGRWVDSVDDLGALVARVEEIRDRDLFHLRRFTL